MIPPEFTAYLSKQLTVESDQAKAARKLREEAAAEKKRLQDQKKPS